MVFTFLYILAILLELIFLIGFTVYVISLILSSLMGAPYVPTRNKQVKLILDAVKFKPGQLFVEIGSGDGRMVIDAARKYGVKGLGIDINPLLITLSRFKARFSGARNVTFKKANMLHENLSAANIVYIFLMPELIKKMEVRLKDLKKGTLVISHGFRVPFFEKKLFKTLANKPFPTYFYRI